MSKWFRSAEMEYVSIFLNEDAAHAAVKSLGLRGIIQFTDLNHHQVAFQRKYVSYIKRCDELERKLRYIKGEIQKHGINTEVPGGFDNFLKNSKGQGKERSGAYILETLETKLEDYEQQLLELNSYGDKLNAEYNEKVEYHEVLEKVQAFFASEGVKMVEESTAAPRDRNASDASTLGGLENAKPLLPGQTAPDRDMKFSFRAGVINEEDRTRFERMVFRATRGNVYVRFAEIQQMITDAVTGELKKKAVFIIFYKSSAIERKINKICDAFGARKYPVPEVEDAAKYQEALQENLAYLKDSKIVLSKNTDAKFRLCKDLAGNYEEWLWTVVREKSVYHTLNMFKSVSGMLRGEGWVVADGFQAAKKEIDEAHSQFESSMPCLIEQVPKPWPTPPTYFETNKFTWAFQEFVNTYGVPRYREANPALFTAATFPFLFGVMYGDIGHAFILFIFSMYLVLTEKKAELRSTSGSMKSLYPARYMLLLMSLFAMYAGSLYNDYFSLPLDLFGSSYVFTEHVMKHPATRIKGSPYPYGVDPAFRVCENELLFSNSMKMKLSVILGIIQMTWGIILRGANAIYFGNMLDFVCEFIPMIIFDLALFGYMIVLLFVKWSINWEHRMDLASCDLATGLVHFSAKPCDGTSTTAEMCPLDYGGTGDGCQPPNLINTLISIALTPGTVTEPMFAGQDKLQTFLLLIAFACVPILLCAKPCILWRRMQAEKKAPYGAMKAVESPHDEAHGHGHGHGNDVEEGEDGHGHDDHGHGEDHGIGEIAIHQTIETIEFVLGMVSNTASYLRLWALSLAHSQLSIVFWQKSLLGMIEGGNPFGVFIGFAIFAGVTFGVIICMDSLECFLHALRLHWVEFQNKFYKADGYKFNPLDIKDLLKKTV